ncbi:hypothetical protein [Longimicrobium sp.]|uniref:hypothetical protein n=1 Tax=Longimicrobium sp. TaxID=2029185 RepID=UPI003B39FC1B
MFANVNAATPPAVGNGAADDYAAFVNADGAGGTIYVPRGAYRIGTSLTLASDIRFEQGAVLKPDAGVVVTLNGALDVRLQRFIDSSAVGSAVLINKSAELFPEWWGAAGNGTSDDCPALQAAMTEAARTGGVMLLGPRTYYIGASLEIWPIEYAGSNTSMNFEIRGTWMHTANTGRPPRGTVILAGSNGNTWTALKTHPLASGQTTSDYWYNFVTLSNLYLKGLMGPGYSPLSDVGLDLNGLFVARLQNIHVEGFSTGIRYLDGSEIFNTGITFVQNCVTGVEIKRTPTVPPSEVEWDMQIWFENLVTLNNRVNLVLDNPRSVWINGGENIHKQGIVAAERRIVIRNCANSQIHFRRYTLEHHAYVADETSSYQIPVHVDDKGLSVLTFDELNYETSPTSELIQCDGYFDAISIRNSAFPRATLVAATHQKPIVTLAAPATNAFTRACRVEMSANSPAVVNGWVKNGRTNRDPLADVVPYGFGQYHGRPQMDQGNDNRNTVGGTGTYGWTTSNVLVGNARLYWDASTTGTVALLFPRPLKGVQVVYVSLVVDDDNGATVPEVNTIHTAGGTLSRFSGDPFLTATCPLETYGVGSGTFQKYMVSVMLKEQSTMASGMTALVLSNIHGGGTGTGLECVSVYMDAQLCGEATVPPRMMSANAAPTALNGYHSVGDMVLTPAPATLQCVGWVCTAAGVPPAATFSKFGALVP